jgi:hypothetical protein
LNPSTVAAPTGVDDNNSVQTAPAKTDAAIVMSLGTRRCGFAATLINAPLITSRAEAYRGVPAVSPDALSHGQGDGTQTRGSRVVAKGISTSAEIGSPFGVYEDLTSAISVGFIAWLDLGLAVSLRHDVRSILSDELRYFEAAISSK